LSLVPLTLKSDEGKSFNDSRSSEFLDSPVKLMPPVDPECILIFQASADDDVSAAKMSSVDSQPVVDADELNVDATHEYAVQGRHDVAE